MAEPTSLLLGLDGLEVTSVTRGAGRVRVVDVVTADRRAARCPECTVISSAVKGHAVTRPRDICYGDDPIMVRWSKTRFYCQNQACERRSFTESIPQIPPRRRTTTRLRTQIGRDIGEAARSVSEVAAGVGVSWPTAHAAFVEHASEALTTPEPVRVLGIDETRRGRPR